MSDGTRNVTREYELARTKAEVFDPGEQPDIAKLIRAGFMHGYAQALLDMQDGLARKEADKTCLWRRVSAHSGALRYRTDCGHDQWSHGIFSPSGQPCPDCKRPVALA